MRGRWIAMAAMLACCGGAGPGSVDARGGGDGNGHPDAPAGSTALYPIAVGDRWTYTVAAVGAGSVCAAGSHDQQVVSANAAGGRAAFQMTSFCTGIAGAGDYSTPGGDEVDYLYQTTWAAIVDPTLVEGHAWTYFNTSYHWHRETSVTVPAGTYADCWTAVQNVSYTASLTYCRGVGLVRSYSSDLSGNGWDAKLASAQL
jgi:hypothetical protein